MSEEEDDGFVQFDLQPGDLKEGSSSEENDNEKTATGPAPATVVYVGHLPFGFFENEMKSFFAQFGGVVNTKIARSTRSARSKGYGWVQFKSADVAAIACKTMNGYMMFKKKLECRILTPDQVNAGKLFRNSRRKMLPSRRPAIHKAAVNAPVDEERHAKQERRRASKRTRLEKELEQLGIEYELPGSEKKKIEGKTVKEIVSTNKKKTVELAPKKRKVVEEEKPVEQAKAKNENKKEKKKDVVVVQEKKKAKSKAAPVAVAAAPKAKQQSVRNKRK